MIMCFQYSKLSVIYIFYSSLLQGIAGGCEAALLLRFSVDAVDLVDIRPTFWPLSTHLDSVTSQVICFTSIYKTIMCERERASQWQDSCSSTDCVSLHLSLDKERRERARASEVTEGDGM